MNERRSFRQTRRKNCKLPTAVLALDISADGKTVIRRLHRRRRLLTSMLESGEHQKLGEHAQLRVRHVRSLPNSSHA